MYHLTGPDGVPKRIEYGDIMKRYNVPKEAIDTARRSYETAQNMAFLLEALQIQSPDNLARVEAASKLLQSKMQSADIQTGKTVLSLDWDIVSLLKLDGTLRGGIPKQDSNSLEILAIFKQPSTNLQRAALARFVRSNLDQSSLAVSDIINRKWSTEIGAISGEYLAKLAKDIEAGNAYATTPEYKLLTEKVGASGMEKVVTAIKQATSQADEDWNKNSQAYVTQFKAQNNFTGDITDAQLAKARDIYRSERVVATGKKEIMYRHLSKDAGIMGGNATDAELKTLESALGVGTLRQSDKAWAYTKEAASFVAIEAIAIAAGAASMGAGTFAINWIALGRNAKRGAEAIEAYNAASKTRRLTVFGARSVIGGGFYEGGSASVRGGLNHQDVGDWYSKEGFAQSIAM